MASLAACLLLVSAALGGSARGSTSELLEITAYLTLDGQATLDARAMLRAFPVSSPAGVELAAVEVPVSVPGEARLRLAAGAVWRLELASERYWSGAAQVGPEAGEAVVELRAHPAGRVVVALEAPPGGELPEGPALARARSREAPPAFATATLPCDREGLRLECRVPARPLDLRIKLPGYAGLYFWDLLAPPGEETRLGRVALVAGGSIVGHAVRGEDDAPIVGALVRLTPERTSPAMTPELLRAEREAPTVRTNARGFFQFTGLDPGRFQLAASDDEGREGSQGGLELPRGSELEIARPLRLSPPVELLVRVRPPQPPLGDRWSVELSKEILPGSRERGSRHAVGRDGAARIAGVGPGRYLLLLLDPAGSRLAFREVSVPDETEVDLEVDWVEVEGRITLGDEPLAADLWFGGRTGGSRVPMLADEAGRFQGALPREDLWRIDVSAPAAGVERRLEGIRVARRADGLPTHLTLRLPDTRVRGVVLDSRGRAIEAAVVSVAPVSENTSFFVRSESEGRFALRGLAEGAVLLSAEGVTEADGAASSAPILVQVAESGSVPAEVELVLRAERKLRGRMVDLQGHAVVGALIQASALRAGRHATLRLTHGATGPDGRFELSIPRETDEVLLYAGARGGALSVRRLAAPFDQELTLVSEPRGGDLLLRFAAPLRFDDPEARIPVLFRDGVLVPPGVYLAWAQAHRADPGVSDEIRIPRLAAGGYTICRVEPAERAQLELAPGSFAPGPKCRSGFLPADGVLEIDF